MGHLRFLSGWVGAGSWTLDSPQLETSSFNLSSMTEVCGRLEGLDSCSTCQEATSSPHNRSESPADGLSGRSPFRTLHITVTSLVTPPNGWHPVTTYTHGRSVFKYMRVGMRKDSLRELSYPRRKYLCSSREAGSDARQ